VVHGIVALCFSGLAVVVLTKGLQFRPHTPIRAFFLVLFLTVWAGGIWMVPLGPMHLGIYWLPFLLVTVLVSIMTVALHPAHSQAEVVEVRREVMAGLGLFFWLLVGSLVACIALRYV